MKSRATSRQRAHRTRTSSSAILSRVGIVLTTLLVVGPVLAGVPTATVTVADWAERIWSSAQGKIQDEEVFDLLRAVPEDHTHLGVRRMREAVARWEEHAEQIREARQSGRETALAEMAAALDKGEYRKALRSAIELQDLSGDAGEVLAMAKVQTAIKHALEQAHRAEAEGRVLESLDWFRRLDLLHENQRVYYDDVLRVAERVGLLAFYTPKRLHEMRNDFAIEEGEEPLPDYNDSGETWREKVRQVSAPMVIEAISVAGSRHIQGMNDADLAMGGLLGIRTLVTTEDLSLAFPGLANETDRESLVRYIDANLDRLREDPKMGRADLRRLLDGLIERTRETVGIPERVIYREFGNGAMSRLDTFSAIIWPDEKDVFDRNLTGDFIGVGIQIELDNSRQLRVVAPLDGTPAQREGVRRGDLIRLIDGKSTVGISLNQAVDRITGERGTKVTLSIEREGHEGLIDFVITRDRIPLYTVKGWKRTGRGETDWDYLIDPINRIGYVRLTNFSQETVFEFDRAIAAMRRDAPELNGLVLDLRFNPGGVFSAATGIANRFVGKGKLVSVADRNRIMPTWAMPFRASLESLPVVVLVNAGSASASEIVAGCLQDHDRGIIIGERTYGKGSVQQVRPIDFGTAYLKVTEQQYLLPSGRSIHREKGSAIWGVQPDITVRMTSDQLVKLLEIRQEADVTPIADLDLDDPQRPDPERLLSEGIDPQLETALLLLRARVLAAEAGTTALVQR
jgi:carboxyl-terminal processing protease